MGQPLLWCLLCLLSAGAAPARAAEDIADVLRRSHDSRLSALPLAAAESDRAAKVRRSFEHVLQTVQAAPTVELRVVTGPLVAETLHGHIVAANESLADMPDAVRLFILAHELGHVVQRHWLQTALLYQKWIPGPVTPALTDAVAGPLGREASALAHAHEFAADAFAAGALHDMGVANDDLLATFRHLGVTNDTATHPGTRKRVAALRVQAVTPPRETSSSTR